MDDSQLAIPMAPAPVVTVAPGPATLPRWFAALQVVLVCGIPTQLVAAAFLALGAHIPLVDDHGITFEFIAMVSLIDTALVALLIRVFLSLSGETSARVFVGPRPVLGEVLRGLAWLPVVFLVVTGVVLGVRALLPWMHNVKESPFDHYLGTPLEAGIFLVVVVLAGGVREELQRAFILHRFEQRLGGVKIGLALFTLAFGAFHVDQGFDVAAAITLLGLFWGVQYIRRRSAILPMVNHASFNAAQVVQAVVAKSLGG